jgi:HD superfamily phosphohydrolase YqeK
MINTEQTYELLNEWFKKYTSSYFCENELQNKAVSLKVEHTYRVCEHSKDICKSINGSDELCFLSSIIALFHDIGRFEQFKRYETFADRVSVNHSELGIEILKNNDVLLNLTREQVQYVLTAIAFHNVKKLPSEIDGFQSELCKIIRDSDKLDIYKIASDQYSNPDPSQSDIIGIGTNASEDVSDEVCNAVCNKKSVDYSLMRSLTDFKLVQLGWVYDLNFTKSFLLLKESKHFEIIKKHLPDQPKLKQVVEMIDSHFNSMLQGSTNSIC